MAGWKPEYPGQEREPSWVWWDRDESEHDLTGFHTREDRDRFQDGGPGPFRRRLVQPGRRAISQMEGWSDIVARLAKEA